VRDTVHSFEETGSPVLADGEQRKYHNFWDYPVHGLANTAPDGFRIPFAAGHTRRMPRLTRGPFRYKRYADAFLAEAQRHTTLPVKQAGDFSVGVEPDVSGRRSARVLARPSSSRT
jgi:5-methyltetrahydropteroyltriglutamate--homocysteine methyltransferase